MRGFGACERVFLCERARVCSLMCERLAYATAACICLRVLCTTVATVWDQWVGAQQAVDGDGFAWVLILSSALFPQTEK
jgi:hypothetical protein